jgi:hypothetical protein
VAERIVEVEWEDSALSHGWKDVEDLSLQAAHCRTVGYVKEDNDDGMLLLFQRASYEDDDSGYCCSSFIPRSAIRKVTELGRG